MPYLCLSLSLPNKERKCFVSFKFQMLTLHEEKKHLKIKLSISQNCSKHDIVVPYLGLEVSISQHDPTVNLKINEDTEDKKI